MRVGQEPALLTALRRLTLFRRPRDFRDWLHRIRISSRCLYWIFLGSIRWISGRSVWISTSFIWNYRKRFESRAIDDLQIGAQLWTGFLDMRQLPIRNRQSTGLEVERTLATALTALREIFDLLRQKAGSHHYGRHGLVALLGPSALLLRGALRLPFGFFLWLSDRAHHESALTPAVLDLLQIGTLEPMVLEVYYLLAFGVDPRMRNAAL